MLPAGSSSVGLGEPGETLYRQGRPILDGVTDLLRHGRGGVLEFDHLRPSAPVLG